MICIISFNTLVVHSHIVKIDKLSYTMANTLYHSFNVSGSPEAEIPTDQTLNDSLVSHVIVKTGFVYYKTIFKVSSLLYCIANYVYS